MSEVKSVAEGVRDPAEGNAPADNANGVEVAKTGDKSEADNTNGATKDESPRDKRSSDRNHRGGRNQGRGNFRNKNKTNEFDNLPETDDPVAIRAQVEFYFSIQNLKTDKHLFLELDGPNNRPVSIKHLHTFKRMRHFQPYSAVVDAVRESKDLVVVDDGKFAGVGNEGVKLAQPLGVPPRFSDDKKGLPPTEVLFDRFFKASLNSLDASIYASGFGDEDTAGQIALETFFKPYGAVMVRKRRDEDGNWKGSVFVEFDKEESQKDFLGLDPKPKFNDKDIHVESKKAYSERKCKEKGIVPAWQRDPTTAANPRNGSNSQRSRGRGRGRGGRGGYDRRDNRSRGRDDRGRRDRRNRSRSNDSEDWNARRARNDSPKLNDSSNKRKADGDASRDDSPKKSKIELKEDE